MNFLSPILDDFNRANENPLSQGGNWLALGGGAVNFQLTNSQCVSKSGAGSLSFTYRSTNEVDNQEAWLTMATKPGTNDFCGVGLRVSAGSGASFNLYEWRVHVSATDDTWEILRVAGGTGVTKATGTFESQSGDSIYARITANLIRGEVWRSGVLMFYMEWNDPSPLASGALALGASNTVCLMDDFGGGPANPTLGSAGVGLHTPSGKGAGW